MELTPEQKAVITRCKFDISSGEWHGTTLMIDYPTGDNDMVALINEHGSVTYAPRDKLDVYLPE